MYRSIFIALFALVTVGCQDVPIGYLEAENARYIPDSLVILSEAEMATIPYKIEHLKLPITDPLSPHNYLPDNPNYLFAMHPQKWRAIYRSPWVSQRIQGVLGTAQIKYDIYDVVDNIGTGTPDKLKELLTVDGGGAIYLPYEHGVTPGTYTISLRIHNQEHEAIAKNVIRFIIED